MAWSAIERVHIGMPAVEALIEETTRLNASHVFLLVGGHLRRETEEITRLEQALGARHAATWSGIAAHAPRSDLLAATQAARDARADVIVTVGGGSVTDAGKILPLLLKHDVRAVEDFDALRLSGQERDAGKAATLEDPELRVICIPTTLSGGEFNAMSGATNEATRRKEPYEHRLSAPIAVVLDPQLTVYTPEQLWLSTGVRAIDHAVETLGSHLSNAFCDGLADSGLRNLAHGLPQCRLNPTDLKARLACQIGAWQATLPLVGGVPMGASHAIGHVLGALCDVPHGFTSCVIAPHVLAWNAEYGAERQARISAALGRESVAASQALSDLIASLDLPQTLRSVGVREERLPEVAEHTLHDIWGRTNPRLIAGPQDVIEILRRAY